MAMIRLEGLKDRLQVEVLRRKAGRWHYSYLHIEGR